MTIEGATKEEVKKVTLGEKLKKAFALKMANKVNNKMESLKTKTKYKEE